MVSKYEELKKLIIETVAMSKPSKIEAIRVSYIGKKHWDSLRENMKEEYRRRAEVFVKAFEKKIKEIVNEKTI